MGMGRRTSACRVTGFSSMQTTGSAELYGFSYTASTSSIFSMDSGLSSATVAVGMPVTQHPPHGSPRAALPHEALILDAWRQSELGDRDGEHAVAGATGPPVGAFA